MSTRLTAPQAIIIGAGHNGLVAAFYLLRSGWKVTVLESRETIGGACLSERLDCGCIFSVGANHFGMLRPEIIRDMQLFQRGLHVSVPDPQMVVVLPGGENIAIYKDPRKTRDEISRYSPRDAASLNGFLADLELAASALTPMLLARAGSVEDLAAALDELQSDFSKRFLYGSIAELIQHYFDNKDVQAAMAATTILYKASPWANGTAFILLYLAQNIVDGEPVWGLVTGGMGKVTEYLAQAVKERGGEIKTKCPVKQILVENGKAVGVELENGGCLKADVILSNADPYTTFIKLFPQGTIAQQDIDSLKTKDFDGACSKLNLLVDALPSFSSLPRSRSEEAKRTLTVISPGLTELHELYESCANGELSCGSYLELLCPSVVDSSVSCGKHHTLSAFTIYTPYRLSKGSWASEGPQCQAALISAIERLSPGLTPTISWQQFLSPVDIERRFGMYQGNVDHGNMQLDNLFSSRPLPRKSNGNKPISNFYLCGAGGHPGGLVTGAPGYNAAFQALEDHGGPSA